MESATCIVALACKGKVYIGGDSASSDDTSKELSVLSNKKVFRFTDPQQNTWLVGFTGFYRFGQLLQYKFKFPEIVEEDAKDLLRCMVVKFIPELQTCLREAGFEQKDKDRSIGGTCIVCIRGRIFNIGTNYSVQENAFPYDAIGCGSSFAFGSLYSTEKLTPEKRINLALKAAEKFSTGVQSPFTVLHS